METERERERGGLSLMPGAKSNATYKSGGKVKQKGLGLNINVIVTLTLLISLMCVKFG